MQLIKREADKHLKSWLNLRNFKVLMILGARQVGKTTLIKSNLSGKKTKYLNLDIEVDKQSFLRSSSLTPQSAMSSFSNPEVLIIDEAQKLSETGRIVKGWYDSNLSVKFIMSGSSSLNLLNQSAENLTGRNIKLYLPPLLFSEVLYSQDWGISEENKKGIKFYKNQINTLVFNTMVFGSYPEAVTTSNKQEYLINLVSDYLLKDVLYSGLIKEPQLIRKLLSLLAYQSGSEVSVNELSNNLGISRITINRYLDLLERTFVIFRLPAFGNNPRKEIIKSQKIYFWDTGIRNALINEFNLDINRSDIGSLWENWIVSEFAKKIFLEGNIKKTYFWRTKIGSEVDLVVKDGSGKISAFEIKWKGNKVTKAFTSKYNVPVNLINRENFTDYLL
ncbi:ATPase [Candidatus Shapirobacteria bacterium CG09_land_8_20_14_0_10_47_13]|uniref:ATPase n=1 Tax=Candidatus Shapirobacteria bacterium CG09_land_8_20_14_0_10_47_13 TaxID=1974481 RepID=A0A2H0WPI0_9BACT|nr:MAG: ATPase [Candidatus Shapirobacteria bacterium CG09_land_8_20_14_0_10_47_13]